MADSPFSIGTENSVGSTIRSRRGVEARLDKHNKTLKMIRNGTMESKGFSKAECMMAEKEVLEFITFYEDLVESMK